MDPMGVSVLVHPIGYSPHSTPTPMTSLYVGDLHPEVTEAMLFEKFSQTGPVLSIRVCRDISTRRSLGYAYVNFQHTLDAERALDTMNFDVMKGRPMRIMWSQRDPTLRRSGVGNIFIKNLDKSIDNKDMYDTFSTFGTILSCKVAMDDDGVSRGYGFVHFETEESAKKAIGKVNGMLLSDKKLFVGQFISRKERERLYGGNGKPKFCNLYIKNIPLYVDDDKLKELFQPFGTTTSVCIVHDDDGKSKGYGFVCFALCESAEKACEEMNDKEMDGCVLYVGRAQKKAERQQELKRKFEAMKAERISKTLGINLYVKNIDDSMQDEDLRREFEPFGMITSAKVMMAEGKSRGFGFVCFTTPEEATKAVTEMSGKILADGKPLYVALAQRREDRRALLTHQYMQRMMSMTGDPNLRVPNLGQAYNPTSYFMPSVQAPRLYQATQMPGLTQTQRWVPPQMRQPLLPGYTMMQTHYRPPNNRTGIPIGPPVPYRTYSRQNQGAQSNGRLQPQAPFQQQVQRTYSNNFGQKISPNTSSGGVPGVQAHPPPSSGPISFSYKFNFPQPFQPSAMFLQGPPEVNATTLAAAHPNDQKQMLGERLFPLIQILHPALAGKITGMLLEMENTEILNLIEDRDLLESRVEEAKNTLDHHQVKHPPNPPTNL